MANILIYTSSMMILPQLRMSYKPLKICAGDFADRKKTVENKEFYMIKEGRVLDALYFFFGTFFIIFVIALQIACVRGIRNLVLQLIFINVTSISKLNLTKLTVLSSLCV